MELARELEDHGLQLDGPRLVDRAHDGVFLGPGPGRGAAAGRRPAGRGAASADLSRPTSSRSCASGSSAVWCGSARRPGRWPTRALTRHLYPAGHPLHKRPVELREAEVRTLTRDDLAAFHAAAYGPGRWRWRWSVTWTPSEVYRRLAEAIREWRVARPTPTAVDRDRRTEQPGRPRSGSRSPIDRTWTSSWAIGAHCGEAIPTTPAAMLANSCLGQSTLTSRLGVAVRDGAGLDLRHLQPVLRHPEDRRARGRPHCRCRADNLERAVALCREVIAEYVAVRADRGGAGRRADSPTPARYRVGLATNCRGRPRAGARADRGPVGRRISTATRTSCSR